MTKAETVKKMILKFGHAEDYRGRSVVRAKTECRLCGKAIFSDSPEVAEGGVEYVKTKYGTNFFFHDGCYYEEQRAIREHNEEVRLLS